MTSYEAQMGDFPFSTGIEETKKARRLSKTDYNLLIEVSKGKGNS